ncbi:MAG: nitronate monooxygenase, partial [Chloroflexi bacterium]|nr:nitronate monooxygenase [Chloroflexota bacterium]
MGVGISNWKLARSVALAGERYSAAAPVLGVVSCTAPHCLMINRLQDGDPGGHIRRALEAFPFHAIAEEILNKYFRNIQKPSSSRYRLAPKMSVLLGERG